MHLGVSGQHGEIGRLLADQGLERGIVYAVGLPAEEQRTVQDRPLSQ